MTYFEYAIQLNDENAEDVIEFANRYGWDDVEADIRSLIDWGAGVTHDVYVGMVWDLFHSRPYGFESFDGSTFDARWYFGEGTRGPFQRIWKYHDE